MSLQRIRDLDERVNTGRVVEWQSPSGIRYRWERLQCRVGVETSPGAEVWLWLREDVRDLRAARRAVFDAINEDE